MNSRQEFEKIYRVENQADVITEALFEIFNKGWEAARKPKYTREDIKPIIAKTIYTETHWDDGQFIDWENLGKDDYWIETYNSQAKAVVDALITAGILTVKDK